MLQSMESQRVRHDLVTEQQQQIRIFIIKYYNNVFFSLQDSKLIEDSDYLFIFASVGLAQCQVHSSHMIIVQMNE